ncbi:MAG: GntR family transcriptional regulator [Bacillota bacterium]
MKLKKDFEHKSLSKRVVDYLKEEIFMENYTGGDRIPETKIADELEISRAPVREALKELENMGLVEIISRKGTFVVDFQPDEVQELYEIRVMLEERVFKILIENKKLTDKDYDYLEGLIDEMVDIASSDMHQNKKVFEVNKRDIKFHRHLWCKSDSKWTINILTTLYNQLQLAMLLDAKKEENLVQASLKHEKILNNLRENNLKGTKEAVIEHIKTLSERVNEK